jgi:DNA processing protein
MAGFEEKHYWIGLNMLLTPRRFRLLLEHFPSAREIWEAPVERLRAIPGMEHLAEEFVAQRAAVQPRLEEELEVIARLGLKIITLADGGYPQPLRSLPNPPPVLYLLGDYQERDELAIALVGTRRSTPYGRMVAEQLARGLSELGLTVVSGLALGIDTAAHRGALAAGGRTIAVLGSGFARPYPPQNLRLMREIAASGAVLSEFPLQTEPDRWNFPRRNRIISGLARGVVVVEAPERSGALITARLALDQGREVFAVPGRITDEASRGVHQLIKAGAKLVEDVEDIIEEFPDLRAVLAAPRAREQPELTPLEERVLAALDWEPLHFDEVLESTGLSHAELAHGLLQLQLKDLIREFPGKRYAKLP